jgi:pimeloyl-ACP methyl ester carboxylesterase
LFVLRLEFLLGGRIVPEAMARKAAALFTTPPKSSRARALAAPTLGARETELDIDGDKIHVYIWGDPATQPYVLFAHGWSSHGTRFLPWVERLRADGYAVVAFDQPAHGRSSGRRATLPEFAQTLEAIGRRFGPAAALVGHSLGGAAAAIAMARGLVVERAVLIAPAADPVDAALRFARVVGLPMRLGRRMVAMFESMVGASFTEFQAHYNAPRIARPALIVHDLDDREVPWAEGERYARYWPDSRLLSTRGLGHNRIAQHEDVIAAALRFLRGEAVGQRVVSTPELPYGIA